MTTTTDQPTTTTTELANDVQFAITLPFAAFQTALRDVFTVGAGADDTLPVLTGVQLECADDGTLTFAATDRYVLAWQELTPARAHERSGMAPSSPACTGSGTVHLDKSTVKDLLAVKVPARYGERELVTLSLSPAGALTVALPDTRVITYPAWQGSDFPAWRKLSANFRPADDSEALAVVKYNPAFLARFAKVMGRRATEGITITQVMNQSGSACSTCNGTGTEPASGYRTDSRDCSRCTGTGRIKPSASRIEAGDVTAIIMHIRLS